MSRPLAGTLSGLSLKVELMSPKPPVYVRFLLALPNLFTLYACCVSLVNAAAFFVLVPFDAAAVHPCVYLLFYTVLTI